MTTTVRRDDSLLLFFRAEVESALVNQHVEVESLTGLYLAHLLAWQARVDADPLATEPLSIRLLRALAMNGRRQRVELQRVGDQALFLAGVFHDALNRRALDVDDCASLGGRAYGLLSQLGGNAEVDVFGELAAKFSLAVDILGEVSDRNRLSASNTDLLRLYERWARTGSERARTLLVQAGVVPHAAARTHLFQ